MHTILVYANDFCRNCHHKHSIHEKCLYYLEKGRVYLCDCNNWVPLDNLEFLEWKLAKKEKENQVCQSNKIS